MNTYEVGQIVDEFRGRADGVFFDMDDTGATLLMLYRDPTEKELSNVKAGNTFELRYAIISDIAMMLIKTGDLPWQDAPYTPHLSPNLTKFTLPDDSQGLALTVIMADTATGEIKSIRLVGLSNQFTKQFFGDILELKSKPFNKNKYDMNLMGIFNRYSTKDLLKLSSCYSKTN